MYNFGKKPNSGGHHMKEKHFSSFFHQPSSITIHSVPSAEQMKLPPSPWRTLFSEGGGKEGGGRVPMRWKQMPKCHCHWTDITVERCFIQMLACSSKFRTYLYFFNSFHIFQFFFYWWFIPSKNAFFGNKSYSSQLLPSLNPLTLIIKSKLTLSEDCAVLLLLFVVMNIATKICWRKPWRAQR